MSVMPGKPPKPCVDCEALPHPPTVWRPTNRAPRSPRCASHLRMARKAAKNAARVTYQRTTYGLTEEAHTALLRHQNGVCWICRYATGRTKALATDHDHACCDGPTSCGDCVRGKLCGADNELIGRIEMIARRNQETPRDTLNRIADYLEFSPMRQLRSK